MDLYVQCFTFHLWRATNCVHLLIQPRKVQIQLQGEGAQDDKEATRNDQGLGVFRFLDARKRQTEAQIFEQFVKLSDSVRASKSGVGFGLRLSQDK